MQTIVIGFSRMAGIGKESKAKYDMIRALVLSPIQDFHKDNFSRTGVGFEVLEVEATLAAMDSFAGSKFPLQCVLEIEQQVRGGKLVAVVTGQKKAA